MQIRSLQHTGHEVFEILVHEHADMLTAYLRSLVVRTEIVDDLFQETMLVAWRRLDDYDRRRPFGPWLRGIATRLVLAHRRLSSRDLLNCNPEILARIESAMQVFENEPADSFRDRLVRLRQCLGKLPARSREVVELAYARGLRVREIAVSVDSNEEATKKRLQRARHLLAGCLGLVVSEGEST